MITIRRSGERGRFDHGWLDTRHTFSFGDYRDPEHMGFRALRVINEDRVAPGQGFAPHSHRDMEILSWVLAGRLEHRDSLKNGSVIGPGEIQRMSAGTGVRHSEFNPSPEDPLHFLQIWILPERAGLPPSYEQKAFPAEEWNGRARLIASRGGRSGSVAIHQDADLHAARLEPGESVRHELVAGRHAWIQVARGAVGANGRDLAAGDGAAVSGEPVLEIAAKEPSELLFFDLS